MVINGIIWSANTAQYSYWWVYDQLDLMINLLQLEPFINWLENSSSIMSSWGCFLLSAQHPVISQSSKGNTVEHTSDHR